MKMRFPQSVAVVSIFLAVFLVGYWFLVLPQFRQLGTVLSTADQGVTKTTLIVSQQEKTERQAKIDELQSQAETLLPTSDKQYDLSVQLEASAKDNGVTITDLSLSAASSGLQQTAAGQAAAASANGLTKVTIAMTVSGTYEAVQKWVIAMNSLDRLIQIDQLTITSSGGEGKTTAQVNAAAYYVPGGS